VFFLDFFLFHGQRGAFQLVIYIILDCPGGKYCPKYGVEYEGSTIVEGILNRLKVCVGGWGFEFEM